MDVDGWTTYDRLVFCDVEALTNAQRALVAIGVLRSEVHNGGFHQYFLNDGGDLAPAVRAAASTAGAAPLADLLDRAMALFGPVYITNSVDRQGALLRFEHDAFAALDAEFRDLEATVDLDRLMDRLAAAMQEAATDLARAQQPTRDDGATDRSP